MGYDVYCYDSLALKKDVTKEQLRARLIAAQYEDGVLLQPERWKNPSHWTGKKPEKPEDYDGEHIVEQIFDGYWELKQTNDGLLFFQPNDDHLRDTDEAFVELAKIEDLLDPSQGPVDFKGEDGYHWRWVVEEGELRELQSSTLYGQDTHAPEAVEKIVEVLWPKGKEIDWTGQTALEIAELLRKLGFGPYAGKETLETLADSATSND